MSPDPSLPRDHALFPGTFDPVTLGHLDLIRRAAALFGRVTVAVARNPEKTELFPLEERLELVRRATRQLPGVEVRPLEGLVVHGAREAGATAIVRGVRNAVDWDFEAQMARCNAALEPRVETVLLAADPAHAHISSTLVRQVIQFGGDPSAFVPREVAEALAARRKAARA